MLADVDGDRLQVEAQRLGAVDSQVEAVLTDVTDPMAVQALAETITEP